MPEGLIRRKNGEFYLTSFAQLIHQSQLKIALALVHSSELMAIDELRSDPGMSEDQEKSIIDNLIDDPELKRLITLT